MSKDKKVQVSSFPRCTTKDMVDHVKPLLRKNPDEIILHVGTNSLRSSELPTACAEEIVDLVNVINNEASDTIVTISSLITQTDNEHLNEGAKDVNKKLKQFCSQNQWNFIDHRNITYKHLNRSNLHLSKLGTSLLARNIISYIKSKKDRLGYCRLGVRLRCIFNGWKFFLW